MAGGPWPLSSPPGLYQPLEDTVVPMFFNCYLFLQKDPQIRNGFMEILPQNYSQTKPNSHLHLSTLAIAFSSVAAWTGQASLFRASEQYFTKALPKIREALQNNDDGTLDEILLSILLLSTYEVNHLIKSVNIMLLMYYQEFVAMRDWKLPVKAHLRGAIALINKRRSERLETPASSTIDHSIQTQIVGFNSHYSQAIINAIADQNHTRSVQSHGPDPESMASLQATTPAITPSNACHGRIRPS